MAKKRETRRQERIRKAFKKKYGTDLWCFKVHGGPFQQDGIGDIVGVVHGLGFMFEVKEPDGTVSEIQKETLIDFREAGGIAAVIVEVEDAFRLIDRALARARKCGFIRTEPRSVGAVLRAEDGKDLHHNGRARSTATREHGSRSRLPAKQQRQHVAR